MARLASGVRKKLNKQGEFVCLEKRFTIDGARYSVTGSTNKELQEKEMEVRRQVATGTYSPNRNITVDELFKEWDEGRVGVVKYSTRKTHKKHFKYISESLGKRKVQKLEKREIQAFQKKLAAKYSPQYVNCIMSTLSGMLNSAVDNEIIVRSPMTGIKQLRTDQQVQATETYHRALTVDEQQRFMALAKDKDEWLYEFFYFSLCTGMRLKEIGALRWRDIDYEKNCIHVTKTYAPTEESANGVTTPKSRTSRRDVPLMDTTKFALKQQKEKMATVFGLAAVKPDSQIFVSPYGKVIESTTVTNAVEHVLRGTNIEPFTHHAFRDTFATRYIENGGTLQTLKTILGHSSLAMTADLYAHVLQETKQKEMEIVSKGFQKIG
jgi:integrase